MPNPSPTNATPTKGDARQIAFVFDLNKCIGCQTCSVACKVLWHQDAEGTDNQWWCSVNTLPGRGTPRDWEAMGGGLDGSGQPILGRLPTPEEFGGASDYNYQDVYTSATRERFRPKQGEPEWAMNWDEAEVWNDLASIHIRVRRSPGTMPGQVVIYNGYEPFQFKNWLGAETVEPGMVKWLHFAGGYGHLQYRGIHWQPIPIDRAVHVDARKA